MPGAPLLPPLIVDSPDACCFSFTVRHSNGDAASVYTSSHAASDPLTAGLCLSTSTHYSPRISHRARVLSPPPIKAVAWSLNRRSCLSTLLVEKGPSHRKTAEALGVTLPKVAVNSILHCKHPRGYGTSLREAPASYSQCPHTSSRGATWQSDADENCSSCGVLFIH